MSCVKTICANLPFNHESKIFKCLYPVISKSSLKNEFSVLSYLRQTKLKHNVPKCFTNKIINDYFLTTQEFRPKLRIRRSRYIPLVQNFLIDIYSLKSKSVSFEEFSLLFNNNIFNSLEKLFDFKSNDKLILSICHGDFTDWNCSYTSEGLFVFDWEESTFNGIFLSDAFYFIISEYIFIKRHYNVVKIMLQIETFINPFLSLVDVDWLKQLSLWLITQKNITNIHKDLAVHISKTFNK
jgi:hypothetical protein